jgi:hypothetical protein
MGFKTLIKNQLSEGKRVSVYVGGNKPLTGTVISADFSDKMDAAILISLDEGGKAIIPAFAMSGVIFVLDSENEESDSDMDDDEDEDVIKPEPVKSRTLPGKTVGTVINKAPIKKGMPKKINK